MKNDNSRFLFHPDVLLKFVAEEALLVNLQSESIFSLNETGAKIARLIDAGASRIQIIDSLASEFEVERGELVRSVTELIETLQRRCLIIESGEAVQS